MRTIAVTNHKGGSAKTTTAVNLAAALGEGGRRVLVVDMDPQGSATSWLGVSDPEVTVVDAIRGRDRLAHLVYETTAPGVQLVPASPALAASNPRDETDIALGFMRAMEDLPPIWDIVLVDSPPSLGYLSIAPLTVCRELLIPVEAHALALAGIRSLIETMTRIQRRLNPELRIAGVLACRINRTAHTRAVSERLAQRFPESFLSTQIRESIRLAEAPSFHLPITVYAPTSAGAEDHRALALELVGPPLVQVDRPLGDTVETFGSAVVAQGSTKAGGLVASSRDPRGAAAAVRVGSPAGSSRPAVVSAGAPLAEARSTGWLRVAPLDQEPAPTARVEGRDGAMAHMMARPEDVSSRGGSVLARLRRSITSALHETS
jgi:chromosome partitioning protein